MTVVVVYDEINPGEGQKGTSMLSDLKLVKVSTGGICGTCLPSRGQQEGSVELCPR